MAPGQAASDVLRARLPRFEAGDPAGFGHVPVRKELEHPLAALRRLRSISAQADDLPTFTVPIFARTPCPARFGSRASDLRRRG
jgi:hypothetical protein